MQVAEKVYKLEAIGLQGGKATTLCRTLQEICSTLDDWLYKETLGEAGQKIVIEELSHASS